MFENLPVVSKQTALRLVKQELPDFTERFMNAPEKGCDEVFDALDEIRKTNPHLIWPLAVFDDCIDPNKTDITDVEFAALRIFLYQAVLLLSSIDATLFAAKLDRKMKEKI